MPIEKRVVKKTTIHFTLEEPIDLEKDPIPASEKLKEYDFRFEKDEGHRVSAVWTFRGSLRNLDTPDERARLIHRGKLFFSDYDEALAFVRYFYSPKMVTPHRLRFNVQDLDDPEKWSSREGKIY